MKVLVIETNEIVDLSIKEDIDDVILSKYTEKYRKDMNEHYWWLPTTKVERGKYGSDVQWKINENEIDFWIEFVDDHNEANSLRKELSDEYGKDVIDNALKEMGVGWSDFSEEASTITLFLSEFDFYKKQEKNRVVINEDTYKERLKNEIERLGVTNLSKKLGVARNTLYNWSEKSNVPLDKLMLMGEHGLNVDYVISGNDIGKLE